jgi:hypothetical protein
VVKRFCVFDPNEDVQVKFNRWLGPGLERKFEFKNVVFENAIREISKILKVENYEDFRLI